MTSSTRSPRGIPDLILLDIHLDEDKSGLAILEELKREEIPGRS